MKRAAAWLLAASLGLALAACGAAPEERAPAPDLPQIVSLNPCLDAILVEVAAPEQILALSHYSKDPASSSIPLSIADLYDATGGTAEEVIALAPDIVIASSFIAPATRAALEQAGLRVETFGTAGTVAASIDQIGRLAQLVGRIEQGEALTKRITRHGDGATVADRSVLLWQPGQIVPGETTLIAEQLRWAGFSSHSAAIGLGQADFVSLEKVLADPPDLLLVAGDARGQVHPMLEHLPGTHVARFEPQLLFCGGTSIPAVRERLLEIRRELAELDR